MYQTTKSFANLRSDIQLLALGLELDETSEGLECPSCKGGVNKDYSFYVTRTADGILYCCHRVSCGIRGFVPSMGKPVHKGQSSKKKKKANPYEGQMIFVSDEIADTLHKKYNIPQHTINIQWRYDPVTERMIYPIKDVNGKIAGHTLRRVKEVSNKYKGPKAVTYWNADSSVKADFNLIHGNSMVVLVEDQPSAMRLRVAGYSTVALLGTNLNDDVVNELLSKGVVKTVLALDADAKAKAMKIKKSYDIFFKNIKLILLNGQDVKDMNAVEFDTLLETIGE